MIAECKFTGGPWDGRLRQLPDAAPYIVVETFDNDYFYRRDSFVDDHESNLTTAVYSLESVAKTFRGTNNWTVNA